MPQANQHYRAFISYSHRDAKWAKWLHKALEQYHVPIDVFPPGEGDKKSRSLRPVFRDRDELPASGSLADTIREALEASDNLIVLCSPNSAASQYVNAEIEIFRNLKPENEQRVYALVVSGDPPGCFPPALVAGGAEPIAADARDEGDGKTDAKLKLIAGILGVGFDRLKRREAKRQRNRLLAIVAVVSVVAVMTSLLALWAIKAEKEATQQKVVAEQQRELAVESEKEASKQRDRAEQQTELAKEAAKEATKQKNVAEEQTVLAEKSEEAAMAAKIIAEKQRELALQSEKEAKDVLRFFNAKVLAAARPKQQDGGLGINATIREAIDAAEPQISKAFSDQPKVEATIRSAIGTSYWYLGESARAIPQLQRALALRVRELGTKNPYTLKSRTVLANAYQRAGRHRDALEMREKNLQLKKEVLGMKNEDTLTSSSNLAVSYRRAGRFKKALALDEETLKLRTEVLGSENSDTIASMGSLASSYEALDRHKEALDLREKVLQLFSKVLGTSHPNTLTSMQNLASSYDMMGRSEEARDLHKNTLALRIDVQGAEHPDTLRAKYNLANTYINAGQWKEAAALHEDTLESMLKVIGEEDLETVATMNSLAYAYWKTGRLEEGEKLYRRVIALQKILIGEDFRYYYTQSLLGELLTDLKKYAAAADFLLAGYNGMVEHAAKNSTAHSQLQYAIMRLVHLYSAWEKITSAEVWKKKHAAKEATHEASKK